MRVLAIRGRNLASLAGRFDIDLEHGILEHAGLYAITGPVGAGKSTLLDALCLALYDRTPRLGHGGVRIGRASDTEAERLRDRDVRTILRRGTAEGFAEVDFVGRGSVRYRARWSVRHAYGRVDGRIQKQTLRLMEIDTGKVIGANKSEVLAAIQECVGLSFEQFCRSVLLAQGDFAAFLKASAKDRASLLERMTGSELYGRLSMAAHERAREFAADLKVLQAQRRSRQPLKPEVRKGMEQALVRQETVLTQCRRHLEAAAAACAWHQEEQRLGKEIADARAQLAAAKADQEAAGAARAEAATAFSRDLERMCGEFQASLDGMVARHAAATDWLRAHGGIEGLATEWPRWQSLLARYREGSVKLAGLDRDRLALEERLAELRAQHQEAGRRRATLYEALRGAERARTQTANELAAADPEALRKRRQVVESERFLLQKVEGRLSAMESAGAQVTRVRERVARAKAKQVDAQRLVASAGERLGPLKVQLAEADRAWHRAQQVMSLADRREALVAGEPCPLCGATEHPFQAADSPHGLVETGLGERVQELRSEVARVERQITTSQTDLQNQVRAEQEAATELEAHEQTLGKLEGDLRVVVAELVPEIREHTRDSQRLHARLAALGGELEEVQAEENAVIALERAKQAADTAVENQRQLWLAAVDVLHSEEQQLRNHEGELLGATSRHDQLRSSQQDLVQELACVMDAAMDAAMGACANRWQDRLQGNPQDFAAECLRKVEEYRAQEATAAAAARDLDAASPILAQLRGLLGGGAEGFRGTEPTLLEAVAAALADAGITGEPRRLATDLQHAFAAESRRCRQEARREAELERGCREATTIIAERTRVQDKHWQGRPDEQDSAAAQAARDQAERAFEAAQADFQETRVKLELDDHERRILATLEPKIAAQEEACRVWRALDDLIGSKDGARFRVFAQSLTLDVLLRTANHHLAELAPRYRLMRVPGHDLDLQVVDLDMAEEIRGVHSLSGGETFLVSLALALALASLSAHETPVESLFIDEGLGTLDTQTLDTALATLDTLQASGRKIGLISHVAGTAERIGIQVRVSPLGGGQSKVEVLGTVT